jgi:CheY-like chemotaxis protein/two-component sensor histidine kinase
MTGVLGMASLLLETRLTAEQTEFAEAIRSSGQSMLGILNQILDFSKIEAAAVELETHPFDLDDCFDEVIELLGPAAAARGLDLHLVVAPDMPGSLVGDEIKLRQIVLNLVSNAIKFTAHGEVLIEVCPAPAGEAPWLVVVRDTGEGIPEAQLARLFQPYRQAPAARNTGGTGLGLLISKRLCELMGGRMWVESQVGQGSAFHFTFRAPVDRASLDASRLRGLRAAVGCERDAAQRSIEAMLRRSGVIPVSAVPAAPGARAAVPEVVILQQASLGAGSERLAELRQVYPSIPAVIFAGPGEHTDGASTALPSSSIVLRRPARRGALREALGTLLARGNSALRYRTPTLDPSTGVRQPLSLLLAEDNPISQRVLLQILQRLGYHADTVSNGFEALVAIDRGAYDAVLLDVHMPEMDGLETARRLAHHPRRPRLVALTAGAMERDREECLAAGMDDYVPKPIQIPQLVAALDRAFAARAGA